MNSQVRLWREKGEGLFAEFTLLRSRILIQKSTSLFRDFREYRMEGQLLSRQICPHTTRRAMSRHLWPRREKREASGSICPSGAVLGFGSSKSRSVSWAYRCEGNPRTPSTIESANLINHTRHHPKAAPTKTALAALIHKNETGWSPRGKPSPDTIHKSR